MKRNHRVVVLDHRCQCKMIVDDAMAPLFLSNSDYSQAAENQEDEEVY